MVDLKFLRTCRPALRIVLKNVMRSDHDPMVRVLRQRAHKALWRDFCAPGGDGAAYRNRTGRSCLGSTGIATIRRPRCHAPQTKATKPARLVGELAFGVPLEHFEALVLAEPLRS